MLHLSNVFPLHATNCFGPRLLLLLLLEMAAFFWWGGRFPTSPNFLPNVYSVSKIYLVTSFWAKRRVTVGFNSCQQANLKVSAQEFAADLVVFQSGGSPSLHCTSFVSPLPFWKPVGPVCGLPRPPAPCQEPWGRLPTPPCLVKMRLLPGKCPILYKHTTVLFILYTLCSKCPSANFPSRCSPSTTKSPPSFILSSRVNAFLFLTP